MKSLLMFLLSYLFSSMNLLVILPKIKEIDVFDIFCQRNALAFIGVDLMRIKTW